MNTREWVKVPPTPGNYWFLRRKPDGSHTQPVFCVVSQEPGDAMWTFTPNLEIHHPSFHSYFTGLDSTGEYWPWEPVIHRSPGIRHHE